jgi:hypothetical protein
VSRVLRPRARLRLAGIEDFTLLELEDTAGGNARGGMVNGIACPLGAHYLPVPGDDAREVQDLLEELGLRQRVAGRWEYDERTLCHSPQERLFFHGEWQDGLLPVHGVGVDTMAQYRKFAQRIDALQHAAHFAIPTLKVAVTPELLALDAIAFSRWLDSEGFSDVQLRWYLDYCCRDDYGAGIEQVSAWAGIHYFASRHGFHAPGDPSGSANDANPERDGVLTWPEGNGWLTKQLAAPLGERLRTARSSRASPSCAAASRSMRGIPHRNRWCAGRPSAASSRCRCSSPRAWSRTRPRC